MLMAEPDAGVRGSRLGYDRATNTYVNASKVTVSFRGWDIYKEHLYFRGKQVISNEIC